MKQDIPEFRPGDNVKVHVKIKEGNRERIQVFEGLVIKRRGSGISETFTVRKVSYGVGVERTFPVHSPNIAQIEVVRQESSSCQITLHSQTIHKSFSYQRTSLTKKQSNCFFVTYMFCHILISRWENGSFPFDRY